MNTFIDIIGTEHSKDADGFVQTEDKVLARARAYKEDQHGNQTWANRAAFSTATALFRFRALPSIIYDDIVAIACADGRYRVLSIENVKGRNMYIEALTEKVEPKAR